MVTTPIRSIAILVSMQVYPGEKLLLQVSCDSNLVVTVRLCEYSIVPILRGLAEGRLNRRDVLAMGLLLDCTAQHNNDSLNAINSVFNALLDSKDLEEP